jgi:lipoate synthase
MLSNLDDIEQGRLGAAMFVATKKRIKEQEEQVIKKLISHYRGNQLTTEMVHGCIGEIHALRTFLDRLENQSRKGQKAERKEIGYGSP